MRGRCNLPRTPFFPRVVRGFAAHYARKRKLLEGLQPSKPPACINPKKIAIDSQHKRKRKLLQGLQPSKPPACINPKKIAMDSQHKRKRKLLEGLQPSKPPACINPKKNSYRQPTQKAGACFNKCACF